MDKKLHTGLVNHLIIVVFLAHIAEPAPSSKHFKFVLIHGASHGAWCWFKIVPRLRSAFGHRVTALDLAASGIDSRQLDDIPSISDYVKPLVDFMESLPAHERVILVGHSLGGLAVSMAMENFPHKISLAVFVTAMMPGPTLNISTLLQESLKRRESTLDSRFIYGDGPNRPATGFVFGPLYLAEKVYQLSRVEDVALATVLVRPQRLYGLENMSEELVFTAEKYGSVRRVFIVSEKDEVAKKEFQEWMIDRNPPDEVEEIKGSDHMVMVSKPVKLSALLLAIAAKTYR
ncbi:methyl jasmonate esterase 1-like [Diospyros lotus]|uniref:methyl jasmonate esterase 1-like n=1 Tax=Diospyros lotus TaxID=55363 RepID=UPI0022586395|nr:methyl jasmonate esterase 1-like [Diospyros lotus]